MYIVHNNLLLNAYRIAGYDTAAVICYVYVFALSSVCVCVCVCVYVCVCVCMSGFIITDIPIKWIGFPFTANQT